MNWITDKPDRRPIVVVEDQIGHINSLVEPLEVSAEKLKASITLICLDEASQDTEIAARRWLSSELHLNLWTLPGRAAARLKADYRDRFAILDQSITSDIITYARAVGELLRPGGLLLQDVQLEPLQFASNDDCRSIDAAGLVRNQLMPRPPHLWFMSNKAFSGPRLAKALKDVVHEEFFDKQKKQEKHIWENIASKISEFLTDYFPWRLHLSDGLTRQSCSATGCFVPRRFAVGPADDADLSRWLDIMVSALSDDKCAVSSAETRTIAGRLIKRPPLRSGTHEEAVPALVRLVRDAVYGGPGVPTLAFCEIPNISEEADLWELTAKLHKKPNGEVAIIQTRSAKTADSVRRQIGKATIEAPGNHCYRLAHRVVQDTDEHDALYGEVRPA